MHANGVNPSNPLVTLETHAIPTPRPKPHPQTHPPHTIMRPISLRTRPLARKPLVPASSAFRPRTRNLAVQSPRPPGPLPAPRPRPYATAPNTQAPAPSPGEVSSSAKAQRKAGTLPAGYKAAERRSVLTHSILTLPFPSPIPSSVPPSYPGSPPPPSSSHLLSANPPSIPPSSSPSLSLSHHPSQSLNPLPRVLAAMVALPILLVTSYVLYQRCKSSLPFTSLKFVFMLLQRQKAETVGSDPWAGAEEA